MKLYNPLSFISQLPLWPNSTAKHPWVLLLTLSSSSTWSSITLLMSLYPNIEATSFPTNQGSLLIFNVLISPNSLFLNISIPWLYTTYKLYIVPFKWVFFSILLCTYLYLSKNSFKAFYLQILFDPLYLIYLTYPYPCYHLKYIINYFFITFVVIYNNCFQISY